MKTKLYPLILDATPRGCVIERHRQFTLPDHWNVEPPTDRRMDTPWAWAIVAGLKTVENRNIHAADLIRNVGAAFQGLGDSAICAFSNLAKWMSYPPALDRMVERRDRFAANAARLDGSWKGSNRRKGKRGYWRRHAVKQSARIKAHPHFNPSPTPLPAPEVK